MVEQVGGNHQPVNPDVGFEARDTNVAAVVWFGVGLALVTALACLVMWWTFVFLSAEEQKANKAPFTAQVVPGEIPKVAPLEGLLPSKSAAAQARLQTPPDGYGWVDRQARIVRVPVERAEAMLAGRLPSREDPGQAPREKKP
jgi:hypothetical protein